MKENVQSIEVTTGSGKAGTLKIRDSRNTPKDWHCRYLTMDCPFCPFFISPDQLRKIVPALKSAGRMRVKIPENPQGICTVGKAEYLDGVVKGFIHKFLLINQYNPVQGCKNPSKQTRLVRAEERQFEGKILL